MNNFQQILEVINKINKVKNTFIKKFNIVKSWFFPDYNSNLNDYKTVKGKDGSYHIAPQHKIWKHVRQILCWLVLIALLILFITSLFFAFYYLILLLLLVIVVLLIAVADLLKKGKYNND